MKNALAGTLTVLAIVLLIFGAIAMRSAARAVEKERLKKEAAAVAVESEQSKAIEAGVGYWQIDESSGEREFIYGVKEK